MRTIFKTGLLQSLDLVDELIKALETSKNPYLCNRHKARAEYLEKMIDELVRSYCKTINYTPQYIREDKK